jgi:phosphoribosylformylglycinamidine (FGAM) synthase-like amidotransferase family enzyme
VGLQEKSILFLKMPIVKRSVKIEGKIGHVQGPGLGILMTVSSSGYCVVLIPHPDRLVKTKATHGRNRQASSALFFVVK